MVTLPVMVRLEAMPPVPDPDHVAVPEIPVIVIVCPNIKKLPAKVQLPVTIIEFPASVILEEITVRFKTVVA